MVQPPVPPQPPQPSPARIVVGAGPGTEAQTIAIPTSVQELAGLRARRSELVDQLQRAMRRRESITDEIQPTSDAERAALDQITAVQDQRIMQIETDIAATERALTNAPPVLLAAAEQAQEAARLAREANRPPIDEDILGFMAIFGMFLLIPLVIAHARRIWKRAPAPRALPVATEGRLERIEQAVEAIAVEVERVSEGQRFVTRLLSESKQAPLALPTDR